LTSERL